MFLILLTLLPVVFVQRVNNRIIPKISVNSSTALINAFYDLVFSFSRNLVHNWSLSKIAKMSSIYLRYNLGDASESLHKSWFSI